MIEKNTVIITGAGASNEYGFPTGQEFQRDIPNKLIEWYKTHIMPNWMGINKSWNDVDGGEIIAYFRGYNKFIDAFKDADMPIDQYISQQNLSTKFEKIAKHAIILGLLEYELESVLEGNWLEELFRQMTLDLHYQDGYKEINNNKITFITFNYDRTIDHFLFKRIKEQYGVNDSKSQTTLEGINTIHVYGKIANLLWQSYDPMLNYGGEGSRPIGDYSFELSENIDLIREENNVRELKTYRKIRKRLKNAERLYILGFGYYDYNIKVLGFPHSIKNVDEVYSTKKRLRGRRFERTVNDAFQNQNKVHIKDVSCEDLLNEYDLE